MADGSKRFITFLIVIFEINKILGREKRILRGTLRKNRKIEKGSENIFTSSVKLISYFACKFYVFS